MEGGDWSNFNVNEEADFMAQLFPNSDDVDVGYENHDHSNNHYHSSSANNVDGGSYYSSSSTSNSHNLYGYSQESSYRSSQEGHHNHNYFSDHCHQQHHHQSYTASASDNTSSSLPFDLNFLECQMEDGEEGGGLLINLNEEMTGGNMDSPEEPPAEDIKNSEILDVKKRPRASESQKGKKNSRAKKNQKLSLGGDEEEENNAPVNGPSSSSGSIEDDCSSKGNSAALNSSGKTRASRGSATDPQSLYARKRRERINERLRILQGLVPNGTKVDISTMLEEAVNYVKFLQLQIKLLSSDDMWMYAPIAYNGMSIGLDFHKLSLPR